MLLNLKKAGTTFLLLPPRTFPFHFSRGVQGGQFTDFLDGCAALRDTDKMKLVPVKNTKKSVRKSAFLSSIALLLGTIIGAGIFGLPYVVGRAGFAVGVLHLVVLGAGMTVLALMYGEIVLRTREPHQFPGYAAQYLGRGGKIAATASLAFGLIGSLIAYVLGEGRFLANLLAPITGISDERVYMVMFAAVAWIAIIGGLRFEAAVQKIMLALMIGFVVLLGVVGAPHIEVANLMGVGNFGFNATADPALWLLPFGAVLFSLAGNSAIPDMRKLLRGQERRMKSAILWSQFGAVAVYFVFTAVLVGMFGAAASADPARDLSRVFGDGVLVAGSLFGVLVLATSYVPICNTIIESLNEDYGVPRWAAWVLTGGVPLAVALSGVTSFISTILIVGSVVGGLDGILVIQTYLRARKHGTRKPEYALRVPDWFHMAAISVFVAGMLVEVVHVAVGGGAH